MKDPKRFAQDTLAKGASKKRSETITMPKDELVREHKKLVHVLRSPSHKDDKREADEQAKELKEYTSKADVSTRSTADKKLADKVISHNRRKLHSFARSRMKKSIDFKNTLVAVDSKDQQMAEQLASKTLIDYIQNNLGVLKSGPGASAKIPFPTGMLTMSEREAGLYHGHFQDRDGQIIEKFDSQTVAIIAKNLQLKSLVPEPQEVAPPSAPAAPQADEIAMAAHNRIDELQRQVLDQVRGKSIRIKYGDFELEIKKSVQAFVQGFRTGALPDKESVRKALTSWRKKQAEYMHLPNDQAAARELSENWEQHQDSFCQFVDALSRGEDEQG